MRILSARLIKYRNIDFADVNFTKRTWVYGNNAQGKSNLLEACGLLLALRSFRTSSFKHLPYFGEPQTQLSFDVLMDNNTQQEVIIEIANNKKHIYVDGEKLSGLSAFIGTFPTLTFANSDINLIRQVPEIRRKYIDMLISSLDLQYLNELKIYHKALASRNCLLKEEASPALFEAFEVQMAKSAEVIYLKRFKYLEKLKDIAKEKYEILAGDNGEVADINLKANCEFSDSENYLELLRKSRANDLSRGYTIYGPHRDDFSINIGEKSAKDFASEGQQRSIVLAIKLAQYQLFKEFLNVSAVLLCDDILGELDSHRQNAFWECIDTQAQVIASSTILPQEKAHWSFIKVSAGKFTQE